MKKVGAEDVITVLGITLIGVGVGMLSVPWALITVGILLTLLGVAGALKR